MKFKFTPFVIANIILPFLIGGIMANFAGTGTCTPLWLPLQLPCWIWMFVQWALITALFLDVVIYWIYARYIRKVFMKFRPMRQPFIIRMTKRQFERELNDFINPPKRKERKDAPLGIPKVVLDDTQYWRKLHRRKTELEYKISHLELEFINVDDIEYADFIELIKDPFRGLFLELTEKPDSLWITVNPKGYKVDITDTVVERKKKGKRKKAIGFLFRGWKDMPVNQKVYRALLRWLNSLQSERPTQD